jgi:EmrB/QacA subfamily drug resistance transporter
VEGKLLNNSLKFTSALELKWKVLISVVFGIFMVILDTTVVNVAFPALRAEYGASLNDSQWIISIYVLSLGIATPLAAYLGDRFGMKRVFLSGLSIFVFGSLACGFAPNLPFLIVARALQGFGGGIALPLGTALLFQAFPPEEQGFAFGIFGIVILVAPAIGPIVGGFLVDHNLWRYIFFINPPIGALGVFLGSRFLPDHQTEHKPTIDLLGLITEVIGFGAVLYAASIAANDSWTSPQVLLWFGIGAAGLVAFTLVELYVAKEPLLDLRLYAKRVFLNANLLGYVSVVALFGAEFLMPIYLQTLRGQTAFQSGLILLPMAITGGLSIILAGRLYDRLGPRLLVTFGFALLIINTWQLARIQADTSIQWIMFLLALRGVALGFTVQTTFLTGLSVVPLKKVAQGSSLTNATRQVMQSIAVAILATVLASAISPQISNFEQRTLSNTTTPGDPPMAICQVNGVALAMSSYHYTADVLTQSPPGVGKLLGQACAESVNGFQRAYNITFYAALVALALGLLLPGWPFKWAGRRSGDGPPAASG